MEASAEVPERNSGATFRLAALGTFFALLLVAELVCRLLAGSGLLYRHFDFSGALTSLPEIEDRLGAFRSEPRRVVLLGDSVLGATALWERGERDPRRDSLSAALGRELRAHGRTAISLGADGLLLPDIHSLEDPVVAASPESVLLLLNFRMFAPEFQEGSRAFSRDFLSGPATLARGRRGEPELSRWLFDRATRDVALFRTTQLLRTLWYFPTQRDALRRLAEPLFRPSDGGDLREAALRLRIAAFYRGDWKTPSPAFEALSALVAELHARGVRLAVVLAPQNPEVVDDVGDREAFERNRSLLRARLAQRHPDIGYWDLSDRYPPERFLDHCHLDARGNRLLARELAALLAGGAA
jgi:hypothetical protein